MRNFGSGVDSIYRDMLDRGFKVCLLVPLSYKEFKFWFVVFFNNVSRKHLRDSSLRTNTQYIFFNEVAILLTLGVVTRIISWN